MGFDLVNTKARYQNLRNRIVKKYQATSEFAVDLLQESYIYIEQIEAHGHDLQLLEEQDEMLLLSINGTKFYVESVEDIFIISEVFVDQDYHFSLTSPCVVCDVGMNIGITSVFLSQLENVRQIYSYEPVPHTFNLAKKNIDANGISKINPFNAGVGGTTRREHFSFHKDFKGNAGVRGDLSYSMNKLNESEKTTVEVKIIDVAEIFSEISLMKGEKLVVKLDCEGGEYEIIEALDQKNLFSKIDLLMIEWHDKGAESITQILSKNGFNFISRNLETNSGFIYAYK